MKWADVKAAAKRPVAIDNPFLDYLLPSVIGITIVFAAIMGPAS